MIFSYAIETVLPWILSIFGICMTYMAGNKIPGTWIVGIISQILWFIYVVYTKQWGFIPMAITLFGIYIRNHILWNKEV